MCNPQSILFSDYSINSKNKELSANKCCTQFGSERKLKGEWGKENANALYSECWIFPPEISKYTTDFPGIELDLADPSSFH
jgi:hypothetical protein